MSALVNTVSSSLPPPPGKAAEFAFRQSVVAPEAIVPWEGLARVS